MRFGLIALALVTLMSGCAGTRHRLNNAGENQVIAVESGDRYYFELEENMTTGYRWDCECDDSDVEVQIAHRGPEPAKDGLCGAPGRAEVLFRVHRGYDGPSTLTFRYARNWEKRPAKSFTITLYKRTGDFAVWK